ncbi:MAG: hypothetical protein Q7J73_00820 [Dehalococcoidales bacterium]|nr:hypothetical protein [Dehalococcoidales bacterium]
MSESNSNNGNWRLPEAVLAAVQGLCLSPAMLHRMNYEQVLGHMDEARLSRLVEPLPLCRPAEVARQIERAGGPRVLFSQAAQTAIASWGTIYQAVQVLRELSKTALTLLRAYRQGQLTNSNAVLLSLPVLVMSRFVPGSEALRADFATILKGSTQDTPCLIKSFRTAALSGDIAILAIDRRIQSDPVWSGWVQVFLREEKDLCQLSRPVTHWEFPESQIADRNDSSICRWLFRRS